MIEADATILASLQLVIAANNGPRFTDTVSRANVSLLPGLTPLVVGIAFTPLLTAEIDSSVIVQSTGSMTLQYGESIRTISGLSLHSQI